MEFNENKMKTLSILIYSLSSGGAERVVSILLAELKDKFDITLFLMNNTIFYEIPKDIKIVYLENSNPNESGIKKFLKLPFLGYKYKKLNKSDISLSFLNRPNYVNIFAKIFGMKGKVFVSERAMPSLQHKKGMQGLMNRLLIKTFYKHADVIMANSRGNAKNLENNFNCKDVININNPFDLQKIKTLSKEKIDFRNEDFTFITIGRMDTGKNHKLLINAIKKINAKLYIIGDGELKEEIQKQITYLKLEKKVFLLDKQSNPYKYLAKADCFVFGSNHEGFPNVLLEALACELPVISTDCQSGPREILAPSTDINFQLQNNIELAEYGILTPVENIEKLTEAMNLIIHNKKLRDDYKEKASKRANDFRLENIIKQYKNMLDKK